VRLNAANEGVVKKVTEGVMKKVTEGVVKKANEDVVKKVAALLPKPEESHTNKTPAHLASDAEDALLRQHGSESFKGVAGQPAVLDETQQKEAITASNSSEEALVAHITASLWPWVVTDEFRSLVNSESFPWLVVKPKQPELNLKPDLWIGPSYVVQTRDGPTSPSTEKRYFAQGERGRLLELHKSDANAPSDSSTPSVPLRYIFGTAHGVGWYDSIYPLAAKCTLTATAFGEEIAYLQHLSRCGPDKMSRGMVFDATQFYLLICHDGAITRRTVAQWIQAGTGPLIREFFSVESPWEAAVRALCVQMGAHPIRHLGIGGFARVIEVQLDHSSSSKGDSWALKVVLAAHVGSLAIEQEYLSSLCALAAPSRPLLASILPSTIKPLHRLWGANGQQQAAAFLLQPVGETLDAAEVIHTSAVFCAVLRQLRTLHRHGVCHGDPRLPNLLRHAHTHSHDTRSASSPALASPPVRVTRV
jgi:hypothetical protein